MTDPTTGAGSVELAAPPPDAGVEGVLTFVPPQDVTRLPEQPDADRIAETVLGCRDVIRLSGGQFGEVATYLPGRRVTGVRVTADEVSVHVVARYGPSLHELSARIRRALSFEVTGQSVEVAIDDIERA